MTKPTDDYDFTSTGGNYYQLARSASKPLDLPLGEPFRHVDRGPPVMYTIQINGDNSDADYTGVSKIATITGYEWRIVGPLAEALKRHEDTYRDKIAALEADAIAARKQVMTLRGVK